MAEETAAPGLHGLLTATVAALKTGLHGLKGGVETHGGVLPLRA